MTSHSRALRFIGVDPGSSGGIAVLTAEGGVVHTCAMPEEDDQLLALLELHGGRFTRAVVEKVHSSPQMGVVSAFSFGRGVGAVHMALRAARIRFDVVQPRKWQEAVGVYVPRRARDGEEGFSAESDRVASNAASREKKQMHKERAQALFRDVRVTHALADALLLAEYARLLETGA